MPDWAGEIRTLLAGLRLAPEREAQIVDELCQHLEDRERELRLKGLGEDQVVTQLREELGTGEGLARALMLSETPAPPALALGNNDGGGWWGQTVHDVRYALRLLRQRPGFTLVATLTLALGIGANTTLFSVADAVLFRPLPYPEPDRLASVWMTSPERGLPEVDSPEGLYAVLRDRNRVMSSLAAWGPSGLTLTGGDAPPERLDGARVTPEFWTVMNTQPLLGRSFSAEEAMTDSTLAVVLSYELWRRRFGQDSSIVGRTILLNDAGVLVTGVMPPRFDFPRQAQYWVPLGVDVNQFNCWCWTLVGRLKSGITAQAAARDIADILDVFGMERRDIFPDAKPGGARVRGALLHATLTGQVREPILVLLAAGGLVLLIACANIANLLLAQTAARQRELALRCCLGASQSRLARQLLTESVTLAALGSCAGLLLAWWGVSAVRLIPVDQLPRSGEIRFDLRLLGFSVGLTLFTALLFGLAPAWRATRLNLQEAVKDGGRSSTGARSRRLSDGFVVVQFGLSLVLLAGAGLVLKSFRNLVAVDPGYQVDNILTARLQLPWPRYSGDTAVRIFYDQLLGRIGRLPGVTGVGASSRIPLSRGNPQNNVEVEGWVPVPGQPQLVANVRTVTPGYFPAIGTPILRGRDFGAEDGPDGLRVGIIDEEFANHFWPGENPLGHRYRNGGDTSSTSWITVVGVVPNVKHTALNETPSIQMYEVMSQRTRSTLYLVVHSVTDPGQLVKAIRAELAALDPLLPLYEVRPMRESLDNSLTTRRLTDRLLTGFALIALLLAAIGVYGVVALNVAGRLREFAVRLALGAPASDVTRRVLSYGLRLAFIGVAIGFLGALWVSRYLASLLFEVKPIDPGVFSLVAVTLAAAGLIACLGPALRATRADPLTILRGD